MEFLRKLFRPQRNDELSIYQDNRILILAGKTYGRAAQDIQDCLEARGGVGLRVERVSDVAMIRPVFFNIGFYDDPDQKNVNVPRGVVLLPEMNQYSGNWSMNITVYNKANGLEGYVTSLCGTYNVPLVKIRSVGVVSQDDISRSTQRLLSRDY